MPCSGGSSLHGAETASSTQLTARLVQCWSSAGPFSVGLTHSTLKVYVAAIVAYHAPLGGQSVGRNPLFTRFLCGAPRPPAREAYAAAWTSRSPSVSGAARVPEGERPRLRM